jgi:hypothetical protein
MKVIEAKIRNGMSFHSWVREDEVKEEIERIKKDYQAKEIKVDGEEV